MQVSASSLAEQLTMETVLTTPFHERRWSYIGRVAADTRLVIKVPKAKERTSLADAVKGTEEHRIARNEYETLKELAQLNTADVRVPEPLCLLFGTVIVTEEIPDVAPMMAAGVGDLELARRLAVLGRWLRCVHARFSRRFVDGFKLDNIEMQPNGRIVFFDPNELIEGPAITDVARFCVTLLSQGYEHGVLPRKRNVARCVAFVEGYGVEGVAPAEFKLAADAWSRRLGDELRTSARRRLGPLSGLVEPWLFLHRQLLRSRLKGVLETLWS